MIRIRRFRSALTALTSSLGLPLMLLGGCGNPQDDFADESILLGIDNGLSLNGLSLNGLSTNGLSTNGLSSLNFILWWGLNPTSISNTIMKYVVRCAVPAGQSRSFLPALTGLTYTWTGGLGLAPGWAEGSAATLLEQQAVSACIAAHVNKYGLNVPISVLGYGGAGTAIPVGPTELTDYPVKEGCFFGNMFNGDGLFVGSDSIWGPIQSSSRDCAIATASGAHNSCPPLTFVGKCTDSCTLDSSGNAYLSCWRNGKSYPALNTRLATSTIYSCGDGICQVSERCGTARLPDNCMDCGPCR